MLVVDKNQHRRDQFRVDARSVLNNDILGKISAESFISIMTRTHARIDRCYSDAPETVAQENMRNFISRKLLTRTRRGQRFERPTRLPSFIEMSGLRPPFSHDRVVTSKTKGKSVALDTLSDPRIPNEDL